MFANMYGSLPSSPCEQYSIVKARNSSVLESIKFMCAFNLERHEICYSINKLFGSYKSKSVVGFVTLHTIHARMRHVWWQSFYVTFK